MRTSEGDLTELQSISCE